MNKRDFDDLHEKQLRSLGISVHHVQRQSVPSPAGDVRLTEVRFRLDADDGLSVLCILKGVEDGQAVVGFIGGNDLVQTVLAVGKRVAAGKVKWREDRPWGGQG